VATSLKQQINPNTYEVDENLKVELGPDGKPNKLKDAFLLRPPNNQVLLIKSIFNKRPQVVYFPYPGCLKMQRQVDVARLERFT
jgi:hypothetical protein